MGAKHPGKKRRIILRQRKKARECLKEKSRQEKEEKELAERAKRAKRNRDKKRKKRERDKAKRRAAAADTDIGAA
jgi:hypothetical protein